MKLKENIHYIQVNITDSVPKIFENAKRAVELGANALMINYLAVGFAVFQK